MIRIGMDISQIAHGGGVATYTQNLTNELSKIDDLEMAYFYSSLRKPYKGNLKNVRKYKLPPTLFEMLFNRWRNVNIERFIGQVDIFHSSDWTQPPTKAKKVTTFHDVVPLKYPQWSHPKIVAVHKRRLWLVEQEIDFVIVVSEATKKDLLEVSKIPEEKIGVIYEGVADSFKPMPKREVENFRKWTKLPHGFILSIGGVGERRNLSRVKKVCESLGYNLVILGETIPDLAAGDLPLLYSAASVLLYPSLYEGFGLPILEAMACGTPVVTSNISSMPEVGEDAALYVDPEDLDDLTRKLKEMMEDRNLRDMFVKKGFKQVKKFSWKKCARETAEIYRSLMK